MYIINGTFLVVLKKRNQNVRTSIESNRSSNKILCGTLDTSVLTLKIGESFDQRVST
jgi:hypothetical protein